MRIISWNVNGIKSSLNKGLLAFIQKEKADAYCFQEVKTSEPPIIKGYEAYPASSKRKGYSGVITYSKVKPLSMINGIGVEKFDDEGRVVTLEFKDYFLVNAYFPNAQHGLTRLNFKLEFNKAFDKFCKQFKKPLIITGDLNVAHTELDIKNAKANEHNAGFTKEERDWFTKFLSGGYIDTFREFVKEGGHYTYWTWRANARARNIGWRLDYFIVSISLKGKLVSSEILNQVTGSDHCPVALSIQ